MMGFFRRKVAAEQASEIHLGNPLRDFGAIARRMNAFYIMTGGKGFRQPPKTPRTDREGLTRGDRKRIWREATMMAVRVANGYAPASKAQHLLSTRRQVAA